MKERFCEACGVLLPEDASPSRRLCSDCAYKAYRARANSYAQKRYQKIRDRLQAEARANYHYWKDKGYCTQCHKEKAAEGHTLCEKCMEYHREYQKRRRAQKKEA